MTGLLGKLVEHFTADPFIGQEFEVAMQDDLACELRIDSESRLRRIDTIRANDLWSKL